MAIADRLQKLLPGDAARLLEAHAGRLTQIRLRAERPVQMAGCGFEAVGETPLAADALRRALAALMEYSLYARQQDLDEGFFTLDDGSRVGVCGRMHAEGGRLRMEEVGSACIRVARAVPGCAREIAGLMDGGDGLRSTLLASLPGMGKTTLLRDLARSLSARGYCVAVADERHEIAACRQGVPTLDVGLRTDVMDGCPRGEAIGRMIRAMAPQVIVADEIGGAADAAALADAARCGVAVAASAHAGSFGELMGRVCMRSILKSGALQRVVLLGERPGHVIEVWRLKDGEGGSAWERA